jgi:Zn-finger nucleic acid-binding protein
LSDIVYKEISLVQCSECQGVWFQEGKFREVKRIGFSGLSQTTSSEVPPEEPADEPAPSSSDEEELLCPDCREPLRPYAYAYSSDIQLHRCARCRGIWADAQDLERIDALLKGYQESLADAKAKVLPLMMKVKKEIQQQERAREEERKRKKKSGLLKRFLGPKQDDAQRFEKLLTEDDETDEPS